MIRYESVSERGRALCQLIARELGEGWEGDALVFVGALGICVRRVLPSLRDKHSGQAVVCVDSCGRYAIPVVGGHVGGACELARRIARITGGEAVITTQSDSLGLWALDTLAEECGWQLRRLSSALSQGSGWQRRGDADINREIALFVGGEPTALVLEHHDEGTLRLERSLPPHVTLFHSHGDFLSSAKDGGIDYRLLIEVSPRLHPSLPDIPTLLYCPPSLHLGLGCQRGTPEGAAHELLSEVEACGFAPQAIATVSTICIKVGEPLVAELLRLMPWARLSSHEAGELASVAVPNPSKKVLDTVGSASVAEAAAMVDAGGGSLLLPKHKGCYKGSHFTFALASRRRPGGHVEIVGAGPGAPDLVSVRGRSFLERADLILYAGSLVPEELTHCAKQGAVVRSSAPMSLDEQVELMRDFHDRGKLVVRLHTGDPCIYGAIAEQMARFDALGMNYHVTPGISSFQASAAELRSELTVAGGTQTIILTRHGGGRTPVPEAEQLASLASHGATMCIFLSASMAREVQEALTKGGYPPDTPVAVCHKVTHKEQSIYRGRLDELAKIMEANHISLTAMIVVGKAVGNRGGESFLYDQQFTHLFRQGGGEG